MRSHATQLNADDMLADAALALNVDLPALIAATSIWASPDIMSSLRNIHQDAALSPDVRRYKPNKGEVRRQRLEDGTRLDDNTEANRVAKMAMGVTGRAKGFAVCHIWRETCYDVRYHTSVANLVLLPQALAALSDHNADVIAALQYRAFELYAWHPRESEAPKKPRKYPVNWRSPEPASAALRARLVKRLASFAGAVSNKPLQRTRQKAARR